MKDEWVITITVGNDECHLRKMASTHGWICMWGQYNEKNIRKCTYENCPHKFPRTEEEL